MENKCFEVPSEKLVGKHFKGVTLIKIENDILYIEFGNGRKFQSSLDECHVFCKPSAWALLPNNVFSALYTEYTFSDNNGNSITVSSPSDLNLFMNTDKLAKRLFTSYQYDTIAEIDELFRNLPLTQFSARYLIFKIIDWLFIIIATIVIIASL